MKNVIIAIILSMAGWAWGDVIELPLNCTGAYDVNTPPWTTNFDLGATFSEISNVYINWSGTITGELAYWSYNPSNTFPLNGAFSITLYESDPTDPFGYAYIKKGANTYPVPESFNLETTIACVGDNWTDLIDGKGSIKIGFYQVDHYGNEFTLVYPVGQLDSATLIFEGTIVPEPSTILFLAFGLIGFRVSKWKGYTKF